MANQGADLDRTTETCSHPHFLILIVEDHNDLRQALCDWVRLTVPACDHLEALSGEEAITLARTHVPAIVLIDIDLPQMNGIETTRQIRAILPETPVVILSFHEELDYRRDAEEAGAIYLSMTEMSRELVPILDRLLRRSQPGWD